MSIEVILFVIVGAVAVAAAVMMLLSENAVHSALFLILNFVCVAFLFLLLEAPFLALVQIVVYAGAIMVLFLFVIMLLGAERVMQTVQEFTWQSPAVLVLALIFLIAVSLSVLQGEVDTQEAPVLAPVLRVAHAFPVDGFDTVDIYLNNELFVADLSFREATDYQTLPEGSYNVSYNSAGDDIANIIPLATVSVEPGQVNTLVFYGTAPGQLAVIEDDLSTIPGREARLTVFNAYTALPAISLVDPGSDLTISNAETVPVIVENLEPGAATTPELLPAERKTWAFVRADDFNQLLLPLRDFRLDRGQSHLIVLAGETDEFATAGLRPVLVSLSARTTPQFGGPASVGQLLFIEYVLPLQLVALLLLAAMVGAIVLTQSAAARPKPGRETRRKVSRPLTSVIAAQTGRDVMEESPRLPEPDKPDEEKQSEPAGN
jgi:NADH:ubiquinone oxidoreductase subunit 6 (subunit J)